jgi:hypothetical protein
VPNDHITGFYRPVSLWTLRESGRERTLLLVSIRTIVVCFGSYLNTFARSLSLKPMLSRAQSIPIVQFTPQIFAGFKIDSIGVSFGHRDVV